MPDSGLGVKTKVLKPVNLFPLRSEAVGHSRIAGRCSVDYESFGTPRDRVVRDQRCIMNGLKVNFLWAM